MHPLLYRVGAWCWIITGVGHLTGEVLLRLSNPTDADAALRGHFFELMGTRRSLMDMMTGFGIAMGVAILLVGVLFLLIARLTADSPGRARPAGLMGLAASVGLLALAIAVLPPPPIATFTVASLAFAAALIVKPATARA
ncbi:LIC_13387 family protein [Actinokineospora sp. HUAS TT18]|uniref:LIC_13387 family protein n=1 Tax=Actinokineospora sp. HUAS TT18 TaxID=3447451 RepID=UPI003F521C66